MKTNVHYDPMVNLLQPYLEEGLQKLEVFLQTQNAEATKASLGEAVSMAILAWSIGFVQGRLGREKGDKIVRMIVAQVVDGVASTPAN